MRMNVGKGQASDKRIVQELKIFVGLAAIPAAVLLIWFLRSRLAQLKRARLRKQPVSMDFVKILNRTVGIYSLLPEELKTELHGHINVFLSEKQFIGCDGVEMSDEIRVTVAGLACILLLNREATYFPGFSSILIYPEPYVAPEVTFDGHLEVHRETTRAGESWHRGPIVLSWKDVKSGANNVGDGYNVVLHEFAHKLDEENDGTNGLPILQKPEHYPEWAKVLGREYESLRSRVALGQNRVLDEYGLTSPPEFFAVATESFFEKPVTMKDQLPDLYQQLQRFYRLDPATWTASAPVLASDIPRISESS